MNTIDLLEKELQKWQIDKNIDCKLFDYGALKAAIGQFVFTIPKYAGNGVVRYGVSTRLPITDLPSVVHIAYFCSAKCNKIVGGMPCIFQVDCFNASKPGLEYYCRNCNCLLSEPVQL